MGSLFLMVLQNIIQKNRDGKSNCKFANSKYEKNGNLNFLKSQLLDNQIIIDEINLLVDRTRIFKLVGPLLILQDSNEVLVKITRRIRIIKQEIKRLNIKN